MEDISLKTSLDDIYIFVKVVQFGSFSKASKYFDLPRSSVSRKVARLEKQLDSLLLERTTRTLKLTPIGETYYQFAERAINELEMAQNSMDQVISLPKGKLKVSADSYLGQYLLNPIISDFMIQHPELSCSFSFNNRAVNVIEEGFDAVISIEQNDDEELSEFSLGKIQYGLFASPLYLQKRKPLKKIEDLKKHKLLDISSTRENRVWKFVQPRKKSLHFESRLSSPDVSIIVDGCVKALGIAKLPLMAIQEELARGILVPVLEDDKLESIKARAYYPTFKSVSPALKAFLDSIKEGVEI